MNKTNEEYDNNHMIIFDNIFSYRGAWVEIKEIHKLFKYYKDYNIFYVQTMQFYLNMTEEMIKHVDYFYFFQEDFTANRRRIYDKIIKDIISFNDFCILLDDYCDNCGILVFNNKSESKNINEMFSYYNCKQIFI